jgi:hypothetical protein
MARQSKGDMMYTIEIVTGTDEVKLLRMIYVTADLAEAKARRIFRTFELEHLFGWEVVIRENGKEYSRDTLR